ncbi:MAG: hypothetical protein GY851_30860 [bacterium]|nr:hypothetical protein [bacterium]
MSRSIRIPFFLGMILLTIVSMYTTHESLKDSILPTPIVDVPMPAGEIWPCSVFAMFLSVAIGLMLFSLKLAIIDEQRRLSFVGVIGLTILAFISISFNMDILYRAADKDFFMRYSAAQVKDTYADYLLQTQAQLNERRTLLRVEVAKQEGELEAEIEGLRERPEGYGPEAKREDYKLRKLQKVTEVELDALTEAIESKHKADELLARSDPKDLDEIAALQDQLRVVAKDIGAATGVPLPPVVRLERPLFAVFNNLLDFKAVGFKELLFLFLAFFIDLGDIVGYTMVPKGHKQLRPRPELLPAPDPEPDFVRAEIIEQPRDDFDLEEDESADRFFTTRGGGGETGDEEGARAAEGQGRRPFRFRRR